MDSSMIRAKPSFTQTINFKGSDTEYSAEILAQDVTVNCGPGSHNHGSSKVKLTNVVDYQWELRYYIGQLIGIHVGGKIIAYGIKGKSGGMLRVANIETNQRALIKDIKGLVQDVSFALTPMQIILGCVDEEGNLYVYNIEDNVDNIVCTLLLHVIHPTSVYCLCSNYRVIWCPYVPSFGEDSDTLDDPAKLLVLLNGNKAEVWDVSVVNSRYGMGPLQPHDENEGFVEISGHSLDIIDASFSPDGTAIATASLDGYVKFFQVYMVESEKPRCLHHWKPHEGKALSCLLFLDNVNAYGTDSKFWKFAITGANHNAELKIWSCETWTCLQTIRFQPNPKSTSPELFFKVKMDMTAAYLLMSDINNRVLYVLQIHKNEGEKIANVISISEFLLPAPFMSFCIVKADVSKFRYSSSEDIYREDGDEYEEDGNIMAVSINMYTVQPKRLQECTITFQPECSDLQNHLYNNIENTENNVVVSNGSKSDDDEEHVSPENDDTLTKLTKLDDLQSSVTLLIQQQANQQPLNLMTPDDFNSPILNTSPSTLMNSLNDITSPSLLKKSLENIPEPNVENLIDFQQPQKDNFASGGSSPSREVQEILALNNPTYNPQEYFDNLSKMDNEEPESIETNNFNQAEAPEIKNNGVMWPNIPTMKAIEIQMKEENRRKEIQDEVETNNSNWNKAQLQALSYRINSLENLIREQNSQIQKLHHEIKSQARNSVDYDMRSIISSELELALSKNQTHTAKLLENHIKEQKRKDRDQIEVVLANISQTLCKKVTENLQEVISHEIKNTVLPSVLATFEKLQHQLDVHYSQKMNTIDQLLKSNISKLVNSKPVTDSLSSSIISVIKPSLEACYKDMISTTLIPSWERVCNSMFLQIHNTFTQGTKEYTSSVESYMDRQRRVQDKGKDLITQMQSVSESMKNNTEKLSNHLSHEIQRHLHVAFTNMQETLIHTISEQVKEQVKVGFKTHAAVIEDSVVNAVRSRAVTPSPHIIDTQVQLAQIQSLIAKGNIDVAFQQALSASASASDLSLVLHVCEKVNPQDVFGQGNCLLQQHVLLSLIQQLGADLNHHTEVKLKYLEEALLNLEPMNNVTREHMPVLLKELSKQLSIFISGNPAHKYTKNMRMLQMATQAILKS